MAFFKSNTIKQTVLTDDPVFNALISYTDTGNSYISPSVLRNSDIFSAINIIASDVASNEVYCDVPVLTKMVNFTPCDYMDGWHFKYALCANMLLNGNAFALIEGNHTLRFVPNSQMAVLQDDVTDEVSYQYTPENGRARELKAKDVLHFKYATVDGVIGISPLYSLANEREIQDLADKLLIGFFNNGVIGAKVLKVKNTNLSQEALNNIAQGFQNLKNGTAGVVALDDDMDLQNLEINSDILKLVNSNDWTTKQIAKAFGLPPEKLGVENEHSNQQMSNLQYLQGSLQKYFDCFTSELSFKLGKDWKFDTSKLLSLDPTTQQNNAIEGYTNGVLTLNEARARIGLPEVDNGNEFLERNDIHDTGSQANITSGNGSK